MLCLMLQGGESLIGDSAGIAAAMPESVLQRFADRGGVRYTRRYESSATGWHMPGIYASITVNHQHELQRESLS
jgi:hypothetical protein